MLHTEQMTTEQDKSIQNQESLAVNVVAIENAIPELPASPKKIFQDMKGITCVIVSSQQYEPLTAALEKACLSEAATKLKHHFQGTHTLYTWI